MGGKSASTLVCHIIEENVKKAYGSYINTETVALMDYDLKPCILCGSCAKNTICVYDDNFNKILNKLVQSDAIFFVVPHYSPIPSKLLMVFEKLNEISYGGYLESKDFVMPTARKPVGIICHGGCEESVEVLNYYYERLVKPIGATLKSLGFDVIGADEQHPYGITFGLKDDSCIVPVNNEIFPEIVHDWNVIEERITPLIKKVTERIL